MVQTDDVITFRDSAQPVGNHHDGEIAIQLIDRIHHRLLGGVIQGARRFIQYQDLSLFVESPSNPKSLPLATAETNPSLTNKSGVPVRARFDKRCDLSLLRSQSDTVKVDFLFRNPKGNVFCDGAISQINALWNMCYR